MTPKRDLVEDVSFIFSECLRYQKIIQEDYRSVPLEDLDCVLPSLASGYSLVCGKAANERIERLAEIARGRAGLDRRATLDTVLTPTRELFVQRFLVEKQPVTISKIDKFLNAVGRAALSKCRAETHLIPCHLMWSDEPKEMKIGPVTFYCRQMFRDRIVKGVRRYYRASANAGERKLSRSLLTDTLRYYNNFQWVAEVQVGLCDAMTSEKLSIEAVTSALDCLHLVFGAGASDRMKVGGPGIEHDNRGSLGFAGDELLVYTSHAGMAQVNFSKGWSRQLEGPYLKRTLDLAGSALEVAIDPDLVRPLSRRFLDAAKWFGEAVREPSSAAKVVKYVTALERMVMTEGDFDIARLVTERVAALCLDQHSLDNLAGWRRDARTIYALRSKIVHGSLSPGDSSVESGVSLASRLARATLVNALGMFGEVSLKHEKISSRSLGKWFDGLVGYAAKTLGEIIMIRYPIFIEPGSAETAFGVVVPDLPGCFSAGDTLDEAIDAAREAAALWIDAALDAGTPIPPPSSLESVRHQPDFAGWILGVLELDPALFDDTIERVNVTLPKRVLRRLDAQATAQGLSRGAFIADLTLRFAGSDRV